MNTQKEEKTKFERKQEELSTATQRKCAYAVTSEIKGSITHININGQQQ